MLAEIGGVNDSRVAATSEQSAAHRADDADRQAGHHKRQAACQGSPATYRRMCASTGPGHVG